MREIKFRAWSASSKTMRPLTQITFTGGGTWSVEKGTGVSIEFQPNIEVLQYTGLKDKNGKEIYEGDVILDTSLFGGIFEIAWADAYSGAQWCQVKSDGTINDFYGGLSRSEDIEVIGNIYENPDLIKAA
jgi:uncharacterized phage protein (TIGR01671 family)